MQGFKHRNKEIKFWSVTGEVLSQNKFSETHLSVSGGSATASVNSVTGVSVQATSPTVHSSVMTKHEFWIMTDNGQEKAIKLNGIDIPLRVGQKITLISAGLKEKNSGYYSVLVNHNSKEHYVITKAAELNKYFSIEIATGVSILFAALLGYIGNMILPFSMVAIFVSIFCIYRVYVKFTSISRMLKSLDNHLEQLAQLTYKNT